MGELVQQQLIDFPEPLLQVRLVAPESPKQAWYEVSVIRLSGAGYLIRKSSGCNGRKPHVETWHRLDYASAMEKYCQLIKTKTRPRRGRQYKQEAIKWQV